MVTLYHSSNELAENRWDAFVTAHPDHHILQTSDWGRLKSAFGWSAQRIGVDDGNGKLVAGVQILYRRLPFGIGTMAYVPAGPLLCGDDPAHPANRLLWQTMDSVNRRQRAIFLKVEPCNWYRPRPGLTDHLQAAGFQVSPRTVQPPRTMVLDLTPGEDGVLKGMNQSTRYKCKLGPKKEVVVREGTAADLDSFNALMAVTGQRDAFGVHDPAYYRMAFDLFSKGTQGDQTNRCALLIASYQGLDLAAIMVFRCASQAYYLYGASSDQERNRMATYVVQWAAIQWAIRHGATCYDLWGLPDAEPETLEAEFESRHDGLWGVYGFKRGFGGQVVRSVGAWDKVYNPLVYRAYIWYTSRGSNHA